ncbi:hypothetical protein ABMA28_017321 [Loxostege sticticalis]|uniref:Myb/SANT-like DNA-binding domain-containing protein n=1 Tax=Loxostege sticticalis TaxID=481309 RepID=A0ABD0S1U2_LOXSC
MSIQVNIADEANGRQISVFLTAEQYERAQRDSEYLQQLVHDFDAQNNDVRNNQDSETLLNERTEQLHQESETPSLFIWNEPCILLLLTLYSEHKEVFEKMRHKMVYELIAKKMCDHHYNVNGSQCQSKINSLKKHFKKIVDHNATSGNDRATWPYFDRMNELFGSTGWANPVALASEIGPTPSENTKDYRKDMKKYREERSKQKQENFNKYMEMRKTTT